ncbi:hypothetical protein GDO81_012600 [Engystomops pustulosus]|uniref:Coiled-coil domain containing 137 n=1 Tax=Engystomops pustulosus TaxID=76066 RepID=A0AAV7ATG3_ENGPU|nr:hypothetical protein GDO81_012600 [Engystomops pustulosus]
MGKRGAIKAAGSTVPGAGRGRGRPNKPGGFHGPGAGRGVPRRPEKKKTNSAPKDLDTQEIPFKLREIMRSQLEMDKPKKKKRPAQKQGPHNEELQTDIQVPKFKQKKNESVHSYLQRMNSATQHVMFLSKNQPDRMPEMELDEKGMPRKELDEKGMPEKELGKSGMAAQVAQSKKKSQNKKEFDQRRLMKFLKKKDDKKATLLEKELLTDKVMFGEVVMAPPTLTVKPRKSVDKTKPGEKQLLLKNILAKASSAAPPPAMSFARKRMLEDERERVVQAYRDLKKRKQQQSEDAKSSKHQHT